MFPTTPITVCFPNGHYTSKYVSLKSPHAAADTQKMLGKKRMFLKSSQTFKKTMTGPRQNFG